MKSGLNGTLAVNTTGIQTAVGCVNPVNMTLQSNANGALSLTSTSVEQCVHTVVFDPNVNFLPLFWFTTLRILFQVATAQYGVDDIPCPGNASSADVSLRPVMFWSDLFFVIIALQRSDFSLLKVFS